MKGNWFRVKSNIMRYVRTVHKSKVLVEPCQCPACINPIQLNRNDEDGGGAPPNCTLNSGP